MTWVIFCSLAFCAFQIVIADKSAEDIAGLIETSTVLMDDDNAEAYFDISNLAKAVKSKEITPDQIYKKCTRDDAGKKYEDNYETKVKKCQQCFDKAKNTKDIQTAKNCCRKIAKEFKKDVKSFMTAAKTYIADVAQKCARSATECRKEARNADKVYDKWLKEFVKNTPNMQTDESNKTKKV